MSKLEVDYVIVFFKRIYQIKNTDVIYIQPQTEVSVANVVVLLAEH